MVRALPLLAARAVILIPELRGALHNLELIKSHMAQKPVLRGEVGCACVVREVSVERRVSREEVWASAGVQGA